MQDGILIIYDYWFVAIRTVEVFPSCWLLFMLYACSFSVIFFSAFQRFSAIYIFDRGGVSRRFSCVNAKARCQFGSGIARIYNNFGEWLYEDLAITIRTGEGRKSMAAVSIPIESLS